ncbi:hypothetical protein [Saccharibacillus brassicae]|uniref:Uncharacterized protein n=1 Tax=Saccharibacillus brassicae TaxID=2583377 RepID=A0A4Y6V1A7_SACBS|nr:hypothetical protein [Saccharibacillus brassicae]QDH22588.1 hypothetical protein FFV09_18100 [Saccharibacillus brassicae]
MLNLLKYDLKRDAFVLLGVAAALILVQLSIEVGGRSLAEPVGNRFGLVLLTYLLAAIVLLMLACRSFRENIRLSGRRLLPLGSLNYVGSAALYALLNGAALLLLAGLHTLYYRQTGLLNELQQQGYISIGSVDVHASTAWTVFLAGLSITWSVILLLSVIFLVISVTESLQAKSKNLIGILIFFAIGLVLTVIESALFGSSASHAIPQLNTEGPAMLWMQARGLNAGWVAFLFELAVIAAFVTLTARLIDRKVKIA